MTVDISTTSKARRRLQEAIDEGREVVVHRDVSLVSPLILRDRMNLVIKRGATLTAPGYAAKAPGVGRLYDPMISGGGLCKFGLDLTDVSGFDAVALRLDTTGDAAFNAAPAVVCLSSALYNRMYGLRVNCRSTAVRLATGSLAGVDSGANAFQIRGGDIHVANPGVDAIVVEAGVANLNRVWLDGLSVEGPGVGSTALRVTGTAAKQAHVVEGVSCEWANPVSCFRLRATSKHLTESLGVFGNAPDYFEDAGYARRGVKAGAGSGFPYVMPTYTSL